MSNFLSAVRDYHRQYYVPHNLSLIVAGKIAGGTEALLSVIQNEVEPSIIAHGQNKGPRPPGWKRPFLETPSAVRIPLTKDIEATIDFPEKDESVGELLICFNGPVPDNYIERKVWLENYDWRNPTHSQLLKGSRRSFHLPYFINYCTAKQSVC